MRIVGILICAGILGFIVSEIGARTTIRNDFTDRRQYIVEDLEDIKTDAYTEGSVLFVGPSGIAEDPGQFDYDDTNDRATISSVVIGIGTKHDGFVIRNAAEVQTTDDTQTTLDSITLLDENTYVVVALVAGVKSDGSARKGYYIMVTAYRTGAGSATLESGISELLGPDSNATFTVSGNDLRVSVTGVAAETWEWGCTMKYINMSS